MDGNCRKSPLGVTPRYIHDAQRVRALAEGIDRYAWEHSKGLAFRPDRIREWAEEIAEIAARYEKQP
jgi:hypothetical protein